LRDCLRSSSVAPRRVLDFGCGTESHALLFFGLRCAERIVGTDESPKMLAIAGQIHGSRYTESRSVDLCPARGQIDLVCCNRVFHHIIVLAERARTVDYIYRSLRAGGLFAFWENSPWNPGTRYVMSRIPFDRDAILLSPPRARGLLRAGGVEVLRLDFLII